MDKLSSLWQGASQQDRLLQSYRTYYFILESVCLIIGFGLSIAIILASDTLSRALIYGLLSIITILAIYILVILRGLISARTKDVNYFQNQILMEEQSLPKEARVLTAFKVYQKFGKDSSSDTSFFTNFNLTPEILNNLIEKGKGHTRLLLDRNLSIFFGIVWLLIHTIILNKMFG